MWNPDNYPDDVPAPDELCICEHEIQDHTPRECKHCSCTYPRPIYKEAQEGYA